jgi:hypothetical protein
MLPNKFVTPDNDLTLSLAQIRNDGKLSFELTLKLDTNKYINGINIIDALLLDESAPADLFSPNTLAYHTALSLIV